MTGQNTLLSGFKPKVKAPEEQAKNEYPDKTISGYPVDEVVSTLQKEIRRADMEKAAWWAFELLESGIEWRLWGMIRPA